jgi:hypothetical protein
MPAYYSYKGLIIFLFLFAFSWNFSYETDWKMIGTFGITKNNYPYVHMLTIICTIALFALLWKREGFKKDFPLFILWFLIYFGFCYYKFFYYPAAENLIMIKMTEANANVNKMLSLYEQNKALVDNFNQISARFKEYTYYANNMLYFYTFLNIFCRSYLVWHSQQQ